MPYDIKNFYLAMQNIKRALPKLPKMVGNEVVNFSLERFDKQNWLGNRIEPWRKRKSPTKWGTVPKRNNRKILVDRGILRRSIRVTRADWQLITVGSNVPYAKAHNEGFRGTVNQAVGSFTRKHTYAGVAGKFKVKGEEFATGAAMSIKTKRGIKNQKVRADTFVTGFNRKIKQNIPQRQFLGNSPYLVDRIKRMVAAEIMRAFKQ